MSENLSLEQATRSLTENFGMTRVEAAKLLLIAEIFLDVSIELTPGETLTVSYREGSFTTQEGEAVREVESLDEQALQEQAQAVQLELFPENPPEDSWEPSPPGVFRVFEEYEEMTDDGK